MKTVHAIIAGLVMVIIIGATTINNNETTAPAAATYEFKTITVVESIVPNGIGRSRMLSVNGVRDYKEFTSTQTEDDKTRNKSKRGVSSNK